MNPDKETKLKDEIRLADSARHAYNAYLESYFAKERLSIFSSFCSSNTDRDTLVTIKHAQMALDSLETSVLQDIETGKLAAIMLEDEQG